MLHEPTEVVNAVEILLTCRQARLERAVHTTGQQSRAAPRPLVDPLE
jgi:hypothetical protein